MSLAVLDHEAHKDPRRALDEAIARHEDRPLAELVAPRGLGRYRGYAELLARLRGFAERGAELFRFGKSVEGEPLFALHFGAAEDDALARTTVVLSGVHPNEWIGIETHLSLLEKVAGADLADRRLVAIPIVNPDGLRRVERNLRRGAHRFVRHNARGVDLNRNFDAAWGKLGIGPRLLRRVYNPGSRPASEPEVESLSHHLSALRIDRALSLHSFGGAVLYPRASSWGRIHDWAEHHEWATRIADAADPARPYRALSCARFSKGFTAGGLELDWFHERHGAVSLLVECSRRSLGWRRARIVEPFAWYNPEDVRGVASTLAEALVPYARGLAP
jgi:hypothetical protein